MRGLRIREGSIHRPRQRWTRSVGTPVVVFSCFIASLALAQSESGEPRSKGSPTGVEASSSADTVTYKPVTRIDFGEGLIEGDLMRPEGSYVVSRKASQFSKLIRERKNFVRELVFSYGEI